MAYLSGFCEARRIVKMIAILYAQAIYPNDNLKDSKKNLTIPL